MSFISPIQTDTNGNPIDTGSMQTLGKDDFLKLLVSKLQNQDPLDPMSDESFVAELAQFSALEQMGNIADGIAEMNQLSYLQSQGMNNMMASSLMGKEVKAEFSTLTLNSGDKPNIYFTLDEAASDVTVAIKDASGKTIRTLTASDLAAGVGHITWDGKDTLGNRASAGSYSVTINATTASGETVDVDLNLVGIVDQVVYRDGAAYLVVDGVQVALGDVQGVGDVGTFSKGE